jgi:hypothetical protein
MQTIQSAEEKIGDVVEKYNFEKLEIPPPAAQAFGGGRRPSEPP